MTQGEVEPSPALLWGWGWTAAPDSLSVQSLLPFLLDLEYSAAQQHLVSNWRPPACLPQGLSGVLLTHQHAVVSGDLCVEFGRAATACLGG